LHHVRTEYNVGMEANFISLLKSMTVLGMRGERHLEHLSLTLQANLRQAWRPKFITISAYKDGDVRPVEWWDRNQSNIFLNHIDGGFVRIALTDTGEKRFARS
jgi:hypothetical protein